MRSTIVIEHGDDFDIETFEDIEIEMNDIDFHVEIVAKGYGVDARNLIDSIKNMAGSANFDNPTGS